MTYRTGWMGVGLLALVGCSDVARGSIDVVARVDARTPLDGALVVFEDVDGSARTATTDSSGHASGEVEPGGRVWLSQRAALGDGGADIEAYTDVPPGTTLAFGPPAEPTHAPIATMTISGSPPAGAEVMRVWSTCSSAASTPSAATFDDRCSGAADVLVVAEHQDVIIGYIHFPALTIADGGTITIDPLAWLPTEDVTIQLAHAGDLGAANNYLFLDNSFGVHVALQPDPTHTTLTARLPLVGKVAVSGQFTRAGFIGQSFSIQAVTAAPTITVDLDGVLGPWVEQADYGNYVSGPSAYTSDDGGIRTAQVMVREYQWPQPLGNVDVQMDVRIYGDAALAGTLENPDLPSPLANYQPSADYQVGKLARLVRTVDADAASQQRTAERASRKLYATTDLTFAITNAN